MPGRPDIPAHRLNLHFPISTENPFNTGTKEATFVSEELVQYRHHIISAKEIGKALLQGVPDTSPFHRSITVAQETLCYIDSVGRAVHPANGSSFLVNRSSFFSGAPEYQPPSKVRIVFNKNQSTNSN